MRYLGGKTRIAKPIAEIVNAARGERPFWDPFCGGLSVSVRLAEQGPGIVSDANPALIALYRAVREGWDPPEHVTAEEREAALALPDSDPRKAFMRIGVGFGASWFSGYARGGGRNYAGESRRTVLAEVPRLSGSAIECLDFLAIEPRVGSGLGAIYCDPPYAGTRGYDAVGAFDHGLFWARVQGWERAGVPVFVSEYACPVPHETLWEKERSHGGIGPPSHERRKRTIERLFRCLI